MTVQTVIFFRLCPKEMCPHCGTEHSRLSDKYNYIIKSPIAKFIAIVYNITNHKTE